LIVEASMCPPKGVLGGHDRQGITSD
jgi:hypothetical protein